MDFDAIKCTFVALFPFSFLYFWGSHELQTNEEPHRVTLRLLNGKIDPLAFHIRDKFTPFSRM